MNEQGVGSKDVMAIQAGIPEDEIKKYAKASFCLGTCIVGVEPKEGRKGDTVWVRGSGFSQNGDVTIQFGAVTVVTVKAESNGDFEGSFSVPPQPYGPVTITARSGSVSSIYTFTIIPGVEYTPEKGVVGTNVSVTGWGFNPGGATVTFDGEQVVTGSVDDTGTITASFVVGAPDPVPYVAKGYDVVVTDAQDASASGGAFQVLPSIIAKKTNVVIGESITIDGKGFGAGEEIWGHFEGQTGENVRIVSEVLSDGTFSAEITVPNLSQGAHKLYVWGNHSAGLFITGEPDVPNELRPHVIVNLNILGDISGDGNITAYDASLALQYVVGLIELLLEQQYAADVTGDNIVTALDAALILQYSAGLITEFPKGQSSIAPALNPKSQDKLLIEAIEQLETVFLNKKQRQVLDQLKQLGSQRMIPPHTALLPNYPNPFNPETWIPYHLAQDSNVIIRIYNIKGELIRTINLGEKNAGVYTSRNKTAHWNGRTQTGEGAASGIYYYTIQTSNFTATRKMVLVK